MDRNTTLCLACSSSLPPLKNISSSSTSSSNVNSIHITNCCQRPICSSCIASNPRLARYDPCLACLGGVGVVASGSRSPITDGKGKAQAQMSPGIGQNFNLDGAVRDEDTFVLGDDDEDDYLGDDANQEEEGQFRGSAPPPYDEAVPGTSLPTDSRRVVSVQDAGSSSASQPPLEQESSAIQDLETSLPALEAATRTAPYKYYINRRDTLQGIALRFGLDAHEICRLNNLPPSVIHTTPHLLHTRAFLLLPPTARPHASLNLSAAEEQGREEKLVRERAEKKLQTLTKEVDWRVAKAYVALADDAGEQELFVAKRKEEGTGQKSLARGGGLEALAVERYLEDEEWEAEERRAGRGIQVPRFPLNEEEKAQKKGKKRWW